MTRLRLPALLDRLQTSETAILLGTSIAVGAGTGLGAVLFITLIALVQRAVFQGGEAVFGFLGRGWFILAPAVGGLLAGPIIAFFAKEAKGHGVPEVMQAIALRGGRIRPRVVVAKVIASALCIGSGGSAGREGPIVQVGSALGSGVAQWLRLSEARVRNLVACGAAAGIAATFNAPIAGVIFAMEIILGELHLGDLGNVVISAVTAATLARVFLGERPAFAIPKYGMQTPWEVLLYVLLGVLSAAAAVGFIRQLYWFEDRFDGWRFPDALKPAVGGLLLGALAFAYPIALAQLPGLGQSPGLGQAQGLPLPHVFGSGFQTIEGALLGELPFGLLAALIVLKPLATSLTLGSGNSGGVFAPALFTGAALGGAFGRAVEFIAPGATAGPGAFAVVGMAAVFAGAARAPFTAILIVFEMTDDYRLIVPLMAGVIVSLIVAERLHPESIYTLKLMRRGIRLRSGRDVDVMDSVRVEEVMTRSPATVPADLPVSLLAGEFLRTGRHGFAVVNPDGSLYGVVSLEDYRRASGGDGTPPGAARASHLHLQQAQAQAVSPRRAGACGPNGVQVSSRAPGRGSSTRAEPGHDGPPGALCVRDIATHDVVTVFPDETVGAALRRMAPRDLSRLPVVARDDARRLLGMVRRNDIVRAYEVGALRREEARRRAEATSAVSDARARFVEVPLSHTSRAAGKAVAELSLPRAAVLVSIRRGRELVIPHGDTQLEAGDVVTALCEHDCAGAVKEALDA